MITKSLLYTKNGIMFYSQGLKRQENIKKVFLNEIVFDDNDIIIDCGQLWRYVFIF